MFYGNRLKEIRKSKGWTQTDLANKCNLDKASICCYEKGTRTPTMETFAKLLDVLEVDANYLVGTDVSLVSEEEERYYVNAARDDLMILQEIKSHENLYKFLLNDPKRSIEYLSKKI